jgi:hypothetical protein
MPEQMDDKALIAIIKANRADSLGVDDGDLSNERAKALDRYHGRPLGNEVEGRSQVVSRDLAEAIDSIMPDVMRVFVSSGNIAEFVPVGPEDEEGAQQESDYTNQVIMQDNNGWMVLYDACKDALLLKNGYVKHAWVKDESVKDEDYEGVSLEDLTKIITDLQAAGAEIKVKAQEEINGLFNVKLQITNHTGKCIIEAVPAEEVRVSRRCRGSLQESPFVEHVTRKTRSQLIEMGMPKDFVNKIPPDNSGNPDQVSNARDSFSEETEGGQAYADRSMDEVEFSEAYLKVDFDGDGIAELRKVVTCGNLIPPGAEWNEAIPSVPITSFVVKRMPHRHVGESIDDDLADIMEIKTALQRQLLDNVFRTNNNEIVINERANVADFLVSLPGGIKRVEGTDPVQGAMQPLITAPIINSILPVIGYYDETKEGRTGVSRATTGLDPDTLRESTKGAYLANLNRASQKIEMLTRMLAETGVKELVQQVHGLLLRYQDKSRIVKLRGNYVSVNPREWKERNDIIVKVGIGTGNEQEKREKLMIAVSVQEKMATANLVGPQHAYNMFTDVMKNLGFELASKYAFDPNSPEYQQYIQSQNQEQPNPMAEAEKVRGEFILQKAQFDGQLKLMGDRQKQQMDAMKSQFDAALKSQESANERKSREAIEAAKLEMQAFLAGLKVDVGPVGFGTMPDEQG